MDAWSNITTSSQDLEIIQINKLETKLGKLANSVVKIRELITRLEICHFKFQQHLKKIEDAILVLESDVPVDEIGIHHIRHGEKVWEKDVTGKSLLGQQYLWAIKCWLGDIHSGHLPERHDKRLEQNIQRLLGDKSDNKVRLTRLLLARLTWDWQPLEELQQGGEYKDLEFQIIRMDICHFAFPSCLDRLLKGIGEMKPIENFEGCGLYNDEIRDYIKTELLTLINLLNSFYDDKSDDKSQIKAWLCACLIKTLKELVELSEPQINLKIPE